MRELTQKFIRKTVIKFIVFIFLMTMVLIIAQSVSPIITNNLALGQMQNSDEAFVVMSTYYKIRPILTTIMVGISILFAVAIAKDTYKFVKIVKNTEKEKGN